MAHRFIWETHVVELDFTETEEHSFGGDVGESKCTKADDFTKLVEIGIQELFQLLPHRYPFLLLDKIIDVNEDFENINQLSPDSNVKKDLYEILEIFSNFYKTMNVEDSKSSPKKIQKEINEFLEKHD